MTGTRRLSANAASPVTSCLLLAIAFAAVPARAETLALTGATVHTVSGSTIQNATILIDGAKITAVGPDVTPPANARVVSYAGKHIYPGLVSANTVLGLTEIGSVLGTNDWQEVGNVNPNIRSEVQINPESELLPVARINGVTTALVVPRGGSVAGTSALIHLDGWTFEDMTVRAPVGLHVQWPNMNIVHAWWETRSEEQQKKDRDQAVQAIHNTFDDARAYWKARNAERARGIPRHDRDVKWDAMGKALRGEIPVMIHASAANQIRAALRFVDQEKLTNVVFVGGDDTWIMADELKKRNIAVIIGGMLSMPRRRYEAYDAAYTTPAKLAAAGVRFCISDGGDPFNASNARNLWYHAAMAAAFGLPRDEALKSVTLYPAQILGVADKVGSIEPGKIADLVVANGDPLEITTTVEQVYIGGHAIPMESRQTRLFHKYDNRPRSPFAHRREGATSSARGGTGAGAR
jgi:imidazolonepropionase-like amidohydrolase